LHNTKLNKKIAYGIKGERFTVWENLKNYLERNCSTLGSRIEIIHKFYKASQRANESAKYFADRLKTILRKYLLKVAPKNLDITFKTLYDTHYVDMLRMAP